MVLRVVGEFETARRGAGISMRELGRRVGVSHSKIGLRERGVIRDVSIVEAARMAAVLGLRLSVTLYPDGDPIRDVAHVNLLRRFEARLPVIVRWRTEVPVPIQGDLRAADGVVDGGGLDAMVEAETRLDDVQAVERRARAKQRDLGCRRLILLVADTRHNRDVLRRVPEIRRAFPVSTRGCLAALARGDDPGGDALVVL